VSGAWVMIRSRNPERLSSAGSWLLMSQVISWGAD